MNNFNHDNGAEKKAQMVIRHVLVFFDSGRLAELGGCRSVQIVTDHPNTGSVQYFSLFDLIRRPRGRCLMEVEISSDSVKIER